MAVFAATVQTAPAQPATAQKAERPDGRKRVTLAVIGQQGDERYGTRRLEKAFPGHPAGRALAGVRLGAAEAQMELEANGLALEVKDFALSGPGDLQPLLERLKGQGVRYIVADLPLGSLRQLVEAVPRVLGPAIVFNTGLEDDGLRAAHCARHLLHTYPSAAMRADALVQYLVARNWRKALLLVGPQSGDQLQAQAFQRAAARFGVEIVATREFRLTGDPRHRDQGNTRLLTGDRRHDVVAVMDSDGEFARLLPYATQWPRPVVGANGLTAQAWHPQWERNGGPQLNRRFRRAEQRPMGAHDWAAWAAAKAVAAALVDQPQGDPALHLQRLRQGQVTIDGFKGPAISFRPWDGQLRQPLLLAHGDGVVGTAPLEGALHPVDVLDTLGVDRQESACKSE